MRASTPTSGATRSAGCASRPGRDDPYPIYERIRADGPVVATPVGNLADGRPRGCASEVLRSRRFGVEPEDAPEPDGDFDLSFLERNPPDHTRLRRLVAPAFSPRRMAAYRQRSRRPWTGCSTMPAPRGSSTW